MAVDRLKLAFIETPAVAITIRTRIMILKAPCKGTLAVRICLFLSPPPPKKKKKGVKS